MVLDKITVENSIKNISNEELPLLAEEIREFLIEKISGTGGHLASNLGVVELTMALHLELDLPEDKIIWDVGHQSYVHKILTGRKDGFDTLRQFGGMSGFPKRRESDCDCFDTGHSSNSISAGLGFVAARELLGETNKVVSVIGDGSLTGGMAIEALNNASRLKSNFIIILNDNKMSIAESKGGIATLLGNIRTVASYRDLNSGVKTTLSKVPVYGDRMVGQIHKAKSGLKQIVMPGGMLFENMGITYLGPIDGHDIAKLRKVMRLAKRINNAVIIHVITKKGKGYEPAERHPARFHGTGPYVIETGLLKEKKEKATYTDVFSTVMDKLGTRDEKVVAITAAMPDGTGLKRFAKSFPTRFFDVGIAEAHAVTFAAGLAAEGLKPVVAVYSSFLQRAYDQIMQDVCMQNLHVIFALDRAGLVGSDGETHHGVFDLSYLGNMPNMTIMAPKHKWELSDMLKFAAAFDGPIAIRYPRGTACDEFLEHRQKVELGRAEVLQKGEKVVLFALGSMVETAWKAACYLAAEGVHPTVVNARFCKPFDKELIRKLSKDHNVLVTLEENVVSGGMGQQVMEFAEEEGLYEKRKIVAIEDRFVEHGSVGVLKEELGLTAEAIVANVLRLI